MSDPGFAARWRGHLQQAGEGYFEHLGVALRIGGLLIAAGLACVVHAVIPALCTDRASRTIRKLHDRIETRHRRAEPAQHWTLDFQI